MFWSVTTRNCRNPNCPIMRFSKSDSFKPLLRNKDPWLGSICWVEANIWINIFWAFEPGKLEPELGVTKRGHIIDRAVESSWLLLRLILRRWPKLIFLSTWKNILGQKSDRNYLIQKKILHKRSPNIIYSWCGKMLQWTNAFKVLDKSSQ